MSYAHPMLVTCQSKKALSKSSLLAYRLRSTKPAGYQRSAHAVYPNTSSSGRNILEASSQLRLMLRNSARSYLALPNESLFPSR